MTVEGVTVRTKGYWQPRNEDGVAGDVGWGGVYAGKLATLGNAWQRLATCSTLGTCIFCHYLGVSNEYPLFSLCCNRASPYKTWNDAAECFNPPHTPVEEPGRRSLGKH